MLHILVLEDNPADAEMVKRLLLKELDQPRLSFAENKQEFLHLLEQFTPDVILADNSLPQFSSKEALQLLHQRSLHIPFILVTGTVSEEFAAEIIKMGADDYILKDRMTRLPAAIESAIKHCQAENEKIRAYDTVKESEERYRTLIERITDAFIALDEQWRYTYINKQAGLLIQRDPVLLLGKNVWEEFPDAVGSDTYKAFNQAMQEQRYVYNVDYYPPLDLWQENHVYPSPKGLSVFIRNITERKKAENEILKINTELRDLSSHLLIVREQERIRIAREIHDELGQQLTALKMDMFWLQKHLPSGDQHAKEKIGGSITLIDDTIRSVRRIASDLRPSLLDDLGLVPAMEWQGQEVEKRTDIKVLFRSNYPDLKMPIEMATGIFRIYQEVLTNAVRHAQPREITSSLDWLGQSLRLRVKDDGKGWDVQAKRPGKTLGLLGIQERTLNLGGSFAIRSEPGQGTEIEVTIPYQPEDGELYVENFIDR